MTKIFIHWACFYQFVLLGEHANIPTSVFLSEIDNTTFEFKHSNHFNDVSNQDFIIHMFCIIIQSESFYQPIRYVFQTAGVFQLFWNTPITEKFPLFIPPIPPICNSSYNYGRNTTQEKTYLHKIWSDTK